MRSRSIPLVLALAVSAVTLGAAPQQSPPTDASFTMALTGDSIITRRISVYQEPSFMKLIDLVRGADVAFTNLEMLFHNYESYPMSSSGGTYMRADPALLKDLVWAGFDMVSRANNHQGDFGVPAMQLTTKYVAAAGLVQAGVGDSLPEAREAKFLETAKARVALISVASTFPDHSRAGRTRGDMPARPGLDPLRHTTTYVVSRDRLEGLRATMKQLGLRAPDSGDRLRMLGNTFVVGDKPGVRTEPLKEDLDGITAVVSSAHRLADYVIVAIHGHEGQTSDRMQPADFLVTFAHAAVDAGADVVTGHGPHVLRGIEIYKGKPILYSLGDFIFENETLLRYPSENYEAFHLGPEAQPADFDDARSAGGTRSFPADPEIWQSVVALLTWREGRIVGLELHPITLGFGEPPAERGRPMLAPPDLARHILDNLVARSKPFGTTITVENGIGRVKF